MGQKYGYYVAGGNVSYLSDKTVYFGPSTQYPVVGSISADELVAYHGTIVTSGQSYDYSTYLVTGTNTVKSGFIKK